VGQFVSKEIQKIQIADGRSEEENQSATATGKDMRGSIILYNNKYREATSESRKNMCLQLLSKK